jgi:hypothetical protein
MEEHEHSGLLQALSFLAHRLRRSGVSFVDVLDNTRGTNKAAENVVVLAEVEPITFVHNRRPTSLVDAEALRVKRALAADFATNELAAREVAHLTADEGSVRALVCRERGRRVKTHTFAHTTLSSTEVVRGWGRW